MVRHTREVTQMSTSEMTMTVSTVYLVLSIACLSTLFSCQLDPTMTLPPYEPSTLPPYHPTSLRAFDPTTLPPYHPTTLRTYHPSTLPPYHPTTLPPYHYRKKAVWVPVLNTDLLHSTEIFFFFFNLFLPLH